jgi:hypothetical protein
MIHGGGRKARGQIKKHFSKNAKNDLHMLEMAFLGKMTRLNRA